MEVTNRFKGLDLIDRVPEGLWTEVHGIVWEVVINTEIKLITFFVAEDGEALYGQQKLDLELTVAQIISFS